MTYFAEKRRYQRCNSTICKIYMSKDKYRWSVIELCDISAGGIRFTQDTEYDINDSFYFDLWVYNMLSEFNIKLEGHVIRKEIKDNSHIYAVKFDCIDKYNRIQLDEVIRSKITIDGNKDAVPEDGMYRFLFIPRIKPLSRKKLI